MCSAVSSEHLVGAMGAAGPSRNGYADPTAPFCHHPACLPFADDQSPAQIDHSVLRTNIVFKPGSGSLQYLSNSDQVDLEGRQALSFVLI